MWRLIALIIGIVCLAGCGGAPVQEMSDARQAIAAARGAGVSEGASQELRAAQTDMARAETHLQAQEFTRARLAAREAKRQAVAALANAPHAEPSGSPNN